MIMMTTTTAYVPVNCEFHDVLESLATRGHRVPVHFVDADGRLAQTLGRIHDIHAHGGEEHLVLDAHRIRLDRLVSVDGVRLDAFDASCKIRI